MEIQNTLENKAKFFAQYWGQRVMAVTVNEDNTRHRIGNSHMGKYHVECCHIELKPLSLITDEEIGTIARFYNPIAFNVYIHDDQLTFDYRYGEEVESVAVELNSGFCLDYLRSNGFATEWMGLSPYKLQEYGWIKLKSE